MRLRPEGGRPVAPWSAAFLFDAPPGAALWARSLTALSAAAGIWPDEALRAERARRARLQRRVDNAAALA